MRTVDVSKVTKEIRRLCIEANYYCNEDILKALEVEKANETSPIGENILNQILDNAQIAKDKKNANMPRYRYGYSFYDYRARGSL